MTSYETFYVDKGLNPFSDLLITFGLANLISALLEKQTDDQYQLVIRDKGMYYELRCSPALDEIILTERVIPQKPIRTLKTKLPESIQSVYDYEAEKTLVSDYFAAIRQKVVNPPKPNPYWDVLRAINTTSTLTGYNTLMVVWHHLAGDSEVLHLLFDLFASTPNDVHGAITRWKQLDKARGWGIKPESTAQQLYNPDSGKGQNRAKADGISIGNVDNFWLIEWLKAVGFYDGALTKMMRGAKDRKTIVIAPRELTYQEHRIVMNAFVDTIQSETSIRFDILAVVRYTEALLRYFVAEESSLARFRKVGNVKKFVVSGFYTAFYKDMGNAIATMNIAFLALPGWITVENRDDTTLYMRLLGEFGQFVRQFDETHSDAFSLLQYLRDFISGDDLKAFFRFTNKFPTYLMKMKQQKKYAIGLTTHFVERLIMNSSEDLTPILNDEGFREIAYAIRKSTVIAQTLTQSEKQHGRSFPYEIRYGLNQDLIRKSAYEREFMQALSDFIISYNAENARVLEIMYKRGQNPPFRNQRRNITTSSIESIVQLIKTYDSKTVAMMLIAYGYARDTSTTDNYEEDILPEELEQE